MASNRFRPITRTNWDPTDHPRDPLGMFAVKGGGKRLPAAPRNSWWDEPSAIPPNPDAWRPAGPQTLYDAGGIGTGTLAQMEAEARLKAEDNSLAPCPPITGVERVDWDNPDGWRGESGAVAQARLEGLNTGATNIDPMDFEKLGGGSMADSVYQVGLTGPDHQDLQRRMIRKNAKNVSEADAELLAAEVGHAIGAPSPAVAGSQQNRREVFMEQVIGSAGFNSSPPGFADGREAVGNYREGAARLNYLDQLTGNRDRHDGNWILTDDGTPVGIDNGLAFGGGVESYRTVAEVRRIQDEFLKGMGSQSSDWGGYADRVSLDEVTGWAPRLAALEPAFTARGRLDWHNNMMRNYAEILRSKTEGENS